MYKHTSLARSNQFLIIQLGKTLHKISIAITKEFININYSIEIYSHVQIHNKLRIKIRKRNISSELYTNSGG